MTITPNAMLNTIIMTLLTISNRSPCRRNRFRCCRDLASALAISSGSIPIIPAVSSSSAAKIANVPCILCVACVLFVCCVVALDDLPGRCLSFPHGACASTSVVCIRLTLSRVEVISGIFVLGMRVVCLLFVLVRKVGLSILS
jgi:hypothetical protein